MELKIQYPEGKRKECENITTYIEDYKKILFNVIVILKLLNLRTFYKVTRTYELLKDFYIKFLLSYKKNFTTSLTRYRRLFNP